MLPELRNPCLADTEPDGRIAGRLTCREIQGDSPVTRGQALEPRRDIETRDGDLGRGRATIFDDEFLPTRVVTGRNREPDEGDSSVPPAVRRRHVVPVEVSTHATPRLRMANTVMTQRRRERDVLGSARLQTSELNVSAGDCLCDQFIAISDVPAAKRPTSNPCDCRQHPQEMIMGRIRFGTRAARDTALAHGRPPQRETAPGGAVVQNTTAPQRCEAVQRESVNQTLGQNRAALRLAAQMSLRLADHHRFVTHFGRGLSWCAARLIMAIGSRAVGCPAACRSPATAHVTMFAIGAGATDLSPRWAAQCATGLRQCASGAQPPVDRLPVSSPLSPHEACRSCARRLGDSMPTPATTICA